MTSHQEWFWDLREPDRPCYVETGDDTTHPIRHVANVPFGKEGERTCIKNVLHVPTITKNLVSVGQIVEQGMQVRFNQGGCFIEKEGRVIARGRREGRMFILESNEVKSAMFARGVKADIGIELWHKIVGHINLDKLKGVQSKGVIIRLLGNKSLSMGHIGQRIRTKIVGSSGRHPTCIRKLDPESI